MTHLISRIRRPVRREGVQRYLLVTLLSFAASVALTRLFLELTGYPQLGGSELHIAHVLWGGLLLFAAALLPLIYANRWVYSAGAVLGGVGVGLFIDEVGKFITQSNDYFYPLAAPLIYAFFLLTVLLYYRARRPLSRNPRSEMYRVLEAMGEVLDRDLEPKESAALEARLRRVAEDDHHPGYARLAQHLLEFLNSDELQLAPEWPGPVERVLAWARTVERRWVTRRRLRAGLVGALAALGSVSSLKVLRLLLGDSASQRLARELFEQVVTGRVGGSTGLTMLSGHLALGGAVGITLILSAILLLFRRDRWALSIAYYALLLELTAVNLIVFYFEQFSTIVGATVQFLALLSVLYYRTRYLQD